MGEFLSNYGFFILIAALLLYAHLAHGGHGGHPPYQGPRDTDKDPGRTSPEAEAKGRRADRGA